MPKLRAANPRSDPYRIFLEGRQYGFIRPGVEDRLYSQLAHDMTRPISKERRQGLDSYFESSDSTYYTETRYKHGKFYEEQVPVGNPGGIFNMEFNSDGSILAAACEKKCILIFDPVSRKLVGNLENAHTDCVNCIRFLDDRTFATCSDDTTVALWDARNLKSKVRSFHGHSNWVKNIEYHSVTSQLVTSGFDGAIYSWDINKYSENDDDFKKVFYTNGLMRMRLTTDCTKMVVSTMSGLLVVIHDLDLSTLAQDLLGFKPNLYRLMQMSGKALEMTINFTKLFHAPRNRVELIADFPSGNDAQVLSSLRLHPQGWVALSRNTSGDENSEWCCVHDIQSLPTNEADDELVADRKPLMWRSSPAGGVHGASEDVSPPNVSVSLAAPEPSTATEPPTAVHTFRMSSSPAPSPETDGPQGSSVEAPPRPRVQVYRSGGLELISTGISSNPAAEGGRPVIEIDLSISRRIRQERARRAERALALGEVHPREQEQEMYSRMVTIDREIPEMAVLPEAQPESPAQEEGEQPGQDSARRSYLILGTSLVPGGRGMPRGRGRMLYFGTPGQHRAQARQGIPPDARIHLNVPRLTHFIEESNLGKGFIKEQCFSPCGRVIASPFGHGVRLLAFSPEVQDLADCVPHQPTELHEIGTMLGHEEVVLSSAFSPNNHLLATGCLAGRLSWHQPVL